jgi:hypothetical protein
MTPLDPGTPTRNANSNALNRRDLAAMGLLVAGLLGVFWKVAFTSAMFFYRDVYNYTYPSARFIHDLCRQGFLPFWNPYLNYGQAVLANPNLLFFYPYTLAIILLPVEAAYTWHFILHFAWAGIGTYLLARAWDQSRPAAFFAAFVFTFSGPVLSLGNFYNESACMAWIPWALLITDRALESPRLRPWLLLTVVFAVQWLAGEPFTFLATFGLCFAYAIYRRESEVRSPRSEVRGQVSLLGKQNDLTPGLQNQTAKAVTNSPRDLGLRTPDSGLSFRRLLAIFILVGCGMLLICAVQLLPASDLLSHSRRGVQGLRFRESANWALNPLAIAEILIPDFFGSGIAAPTGWLWLMSDRNVPYLLSTFLGFVPVFFALAGWALASRSRRNFVAGAAGVLLLLSFGHFTPIFALAYLLLPPLMVVRYPIKLLVVVVFLVAILAGWGFDALRSPAAAWKAQRKRLLLPLQIFLGGIVAVLAVAWLTPAIIMAPTSRILNALGESPFNLMQMPDFLVTILRYELPGLAGFCLGGIVLAAGLEQGKRWARPGLYAFAALAMVELLMVNSAANPTVPQSFFTYRPPVLAQFKAPAGTYRVTSFWPIILTPDTKNLQTYISFESVPEAANLDPMAQGAFQARLQLAAGSMLNQVEGNINLDIERSLPPYLYDVEIYLSRLGSDYLHADCLLGRTNVKYIIRPAPADSAATRLVGDVFNGSPIPSRLYEDLYYVPRAYVAGQARCSTDSQETLRLMASPEFDALDTAILAAPAGSAPPASGPEPAGQVEIVHRDPNSVTLSAQLSRPGYVLLLDRYDPSWQATIDGHSTTVWRANQIFRAVYAGAGRHEIRFDYRQRGLRLGLIISLATLMTMAALAYFSR